MAVHSGSAKNKRKRPPGRKAKERSKRHKLHKAREARADSLPLSEPAVGPKRQQEQHEKQSAAVVTDSEASSKESRQELPKKKRVKSAESTNSVNMFEALSS